MTYDEKQPGRVENEASSDGSMAVTHLPARAARGLRRPIVSKRGQVSIDFAVPVMRQGGPDARPWAAAGAIEAETLAIWAFRDQRADRHAGAGLHRIEAEVGGIETQSWSTDGCAALAEIEHMGCRIDKRIGIVRDHVHPAAEAVADALQRIAGGDFVRHYARLGGRPEGWSEPKRWWRPVVWVKDGVEGQWERTGPGNSPRMCRVIPTVTRAEIQRRRDAYGLWWEALDLMHWRLSMKALGFAVLPPTAPRAPWLEAEGA